MYAIYVCGSWSSLYCITPMNAKISRQFWGFHQPCHTKKMFIDWCHVGVPAQIQVYMELWIILGRVEADSKDLISIWCGSNTSLLINTPLLVWMGGFNCSKKLLSQIDVPACPWTLIWPNAYASSTFQTLFDPLPTWILQVMKNLGSHWHWWHLPGQLPML